MSLTLSSEDLSRLTQVMRTLLSPLDHASLEDWGREAMHSMQQLLGADQWVFGGPLPDRSYLTVVQDANGAAAARAYYAYFYKVDKALHERRRERGLRVHHRDLLYDPGELEHDELHNDWCVPYRLYDTLGVSLSVPEHPTWPFLAHFYHERPQVPEFGERGQQLLHLLYPAFQSGVETVRRLLHRRNEIARLVDLLDQGLLLYDASGTLLHRNDAAGRALASETEWDQTRVEREAGRIALHLAGLLRRIGDPERVERPTRQVRTARSTYRLAGSLLQESVLGRAPVVAVTLARETPEPRSDAALRQRFGLTERQFEVGRLMAEGLSNGAIADLLGVTRHTAARHAEQVRAKLGVHSRAAVGARLRSD